jgi:hypothetical protein
VAVEFGGERRGGLGEVVEHLFVGVEALAHAIELRIHVHLHAPLLVQFEFLHIQFDSVTMAGVSR